MRKIILLGLLASIFAFTSCSTQKIDSDDDFSVEAGTGDAAGDELALDGDTGSAPADDLSLEEEDGNAAKNEAPPDSDLALENELNSLDTDKPAEPPPAAAGNSEQDLSLDEPAPQVAANEPPPPLPVEETPPPPEVAAPVAETPPPEPPPAAMEPAPVMAETPAPSPSGEPATISNVQYKGNSNGGTIAISADRPLAFTTRMNSTTNQFVVEVQNSVIPPKLKRSLNTKDMASSIGSVDIYQKDGSNVARFVVQLRPGSTDPIIQQEGNSLLVIGAAVAQNGASEAPAQAAAPAFEEPPAPSIVPTETAADQPTPVAPTEPETPQLAELEPATSAETSTTAAADAPKFKGGLLNYETLDQFLMNNTKFYGNKVTFETYGMDTAEALKFLAEEGGINLIIDDAVLTAGKVNLKLREVPWDQAFVLILKSKKLVYKRQGNVVRVATLADIKKDEEDAIAMKEARKAPEPLAVKRFFISYAEITDVSQKIADYLKLLTPSDPKAPVDPNAGKVLLDKRNNFIIVTDTEANLKKVEQIITALDTQPKQVLIEAKIVEANEDFAHAMGVSWSIAKSVPSTAGYSSSLTATSNGQVTVQWANLNVFDNLNAVLNLAENESRAKVLSSPRITVVSGNSANISSTSDVVTQQASTIGTGTGTTSGVQRTPVGITFGVTPVANNGGTVKLALNITRSSPSGNLGGTSQKTATTELYVKSGATTVIGGIYQTIANDGETGIVGLRKIPLLGMLFKNASVSTKKEELLMFITPTILKPL